MPTDTRKQSFASRRQQEARNLIHSLTDLGMSLGAISEETGIARSTISAWFRDAKPTPRTVSRLQFILDRIKNEMVEKTEREIANSEIENWYAEGGNERVARFEEWIHTNGDELRSDAPTFDKAFAHWKTENAHKNIGRKYRLLGSQN